MTSHAQTQHSRATVLFSYGFRPFFLFGALWAALAMALWISMLAGLTMLPTRLDPVSWHAHEFLFGYLGAIIAGFLLTAIPNWTGRPPVMGWPLIGLFTLWFCGRIALALSALLPIGIPEAVDVLFPLALGAVILREILAGKNWRNLVVLIMLGVFVVANVLFHLEAARGDFAAQGAGLRLGVAAVIMMISVIGGRIIPTFTRNWMVKAGRTDLPPAPMQMFDKGVLLVSIVALVSWVTQPASNLCGIALIGTGLLHLMRLLRWKGYTTLAEPLLAILHLGYLFVPLGAMLEGGAILNPDILPPGPALHLWMAGGFALMTLAVMIRATLGHTGQDLNASIGSILIFVSVIGSVAARVCAGIWPEGAMVFYTLSAILWIGAFAGFSVVFGPALLRLKA